MEFLKYQHVERFGTPNVRNIEFGECYIFPKIDGTNASVWVNEEGGLQAGSRRRHLTLEQDNAGFYAWVLEQDNLKEFFKMFPEVRLYGEWLKPHTLKTYNDSAWGNFYVFDVVVGNSGKHMHYEDYKDKLDKFSINYIPPLCKVQNPTIETLTSLLEKNTYLIKDGEGFGEGIVIKRYDYTNSHGNQVWAKIVANEFKFKHKKVFKVGELKEKNLVEQDIVEKYVTKSLCEKEYAKICLEVEWEPKYINRLLNTIYYSLVTEECWNFVKDFKRPTVNFKTLFHYTVSKVKESLPEVF